MRLCTVSNRQPHKINTKRNDKKISALIGLCSLLASTNLYTLLQIATVEQGSSIDLEGKIR
jgi:hypothetical protein